MCRLHVRGAGATRAIAPVLILAIVLIVLGLIATFIVPGGFIVPIVGVALLVAYLFGFGKRAADSGA